jgi:glycosyltransferase involved in cell wall biosynthesis
MLNEVKSRGLNNLHLPGRFPVETMPGLMQKASILLATLADRAVFAATVPSKVQAYMAAGRPIIACMNGEGARLVLQSGSGLAVNAEDSKGLAEAIIKLYLTTKSEREEMGNKGHQYYKMHFNHATLMNDLIAHFDVVRQKKRE